MKRIAPRLWILCAIVASVACTASVGPEIGHEKRAALASLGVADVSWNDDHFVLFDAEGNASGEIRTAEGVIRASLDGATFSAGPEGVACNGAEVDDARTLNACLAPMAAASILRGDDSSEIAGAQAALLDSCPIYTTSGCVQWTAEDGCLLLMECTVITCFPFYEYSCRETFQ